MQTDRLGIMPDRLRPTYTLPKLQKLRKFRFQAENAAGNQIMLNTKLTQTALEDQE